MIWLFYFSNCFLFWNVIQSVRFLGKKTFRGANTQLCHADLILACHAKFLLLFNMIRSMIRSMIRDSVRDPIRDPVLSDPDFVDAANLNDIDSNRPLSRSFQSHNLHPRVTGFVYAFRFTFFPFLISLFNFSNLKDTICSPKLCNKKYRSPCLFTGDRPLYHFTWSMDWKSIPYSRNARAHSLNHVILKRKIGCVVQNWGITLTVANALDGILPWAFTLILYEWFLLVVKIKMKT